MTGGILTGQNLIRAAELRSITTEYQRYQTATNTFRDRYFALPGDMRNATDFWGAAATCPGDLDEARTGAATCNGDGVIEWESPATIVNERFGFWQHLANAGLIEGSYIGVAYNAASVFSSHKLVGVNVPASKISGVGWDVPYRASSIDVSSTSLVEGAYGNSFEISRWNLSATGAFLSGEEAWGIDKKNDDGIAGSGKVVVRESDTGCYYLADGSAVASSSSAVRSDIQYRLDDTSLACSLHFRQSF